MLSLSFRVGASFLDYPRHPTTIPKSPLDYGDVDRLIAGATDVAIEFPNSVPIPAKVVRGIAGFREYRQIRTNDEASWPLVVATQGQVVDVSLTRSADQFQIVVRAR